MREIVEGNTHELADVEAFVSDLGDRQGVVETYLDPKREIIVTRAPGRLDVMGGIADYSGSLVLQMPIAEAAFAAIQANDDHVIRIASVDNRAATTRRFEMPLAEIGRLQVSEYPEIAQHFGGDHHWAGYAAGVFLVLAKEKGVAFISGANVLIASDVPIGKGVSSSAALEVAVMQAVATLYGLGLSSRELALLCQKVENHIVGAACGVMDQVTSHCGVEAHLTALLCQPAEILAPVVIPDAIEFRGIDSGVRHAVVGSDYRSVRVGAFMGYRMIAQKAGLAVDITGPGKVRVDDHRWRGYLANLSVEEYEQEFREAMPSKIAGGDFISEFGGITDPVTEVDPARNYAVRPATEHPIYESDRVNRFRALLMRPIVEEALTEMGELMFASHASYGACALTEPRTDRLAEMVRQRRNEGLYGARITGGGSGGTVAILARKGSESAILDLARCYADETGEMPRIFRGSSPGCAQFGHVRLSPD